MPKTMTIEQLEKEHAMYREFYNAIMNLPEGASLDDYRKVVAKMDSSIGLITSFFKQKGWDYARHAD